MGKAKKLFGETKMTWKRVILLAVITAAFTALVLCLEFLDNTSFQDIGISFECWFLFAIYIIVNCDKWYEASLKTFVFFLISQPLIYLLQVPFSWLGWGIFQYYKTWFIFTLLTLPGAAIAFLLKKKNWLSVAVLAVPTGFLANACVGYGARAYRSFPHHLLSSAFCLALGIFFVIVLLDEKKHKIAQFIYMAIMIAIPLVGPSLRLV